MPINDKELNFLGDIRIGVYMEVEAGKIIKNCIDIKGKIYDIHCNFSNFEAKKKLIKIKGKRRRNLFLTKTFKEEKRVTVINFAERTRKYLPNPLEIVGMKTPQDQYAALNTYVINLNSNGILNTIIQSIKDEKVNKSPFLPPHIRKLFLKSFFKLIPSIVDYLVEVLEQEGIAFGELIPDDDEYRSDGRLADIYWYFWQAPLSLKIMKKIVNEKEHELHHALAERVQIKKLLPLEIIDELLKKRWTVRRILIERGHGRFLPLSIFKKLALDEEGIIQEIISNFFKDKLLQILEHPSTSEIERNHIIKRYQL